MNRNAKIGIVLFLIYTTFYSGFVWLNAFHPQIMATRPMWGINLATVYGFGLIFLAFIMSLLYGALCSIYGNRQGDAQ